MQPGNLRHTHTTTRERGGLKKKKRKEEEGFDSRRRRLSWCDVCAIGFHSTFAPHCPARLCAPPSPGITGSLQIKSRQTNASIPGYEIIPLTSRILFSSPGGQQQQQPVRNRLCSGVCVGHGCVFFHRHCRFHHCVWRRSHLGHARKVASCLQRTEKRKKKNPSISGLFFPCSFRGSAYYKTGSVSRAKKTLRPNPQSPASLFIPFPLPPNFMTLIITNDKRTRNPREEEEIDFKSGDIQLRRKNRSGLLSADGAAAI